MTRSGRGHWSLAIVVVVLATVLLAGPGSGHASTAAKLPSSGAPSHGAADSRPLATGPPNWTPVATNTAPSTRRDMATVYDPSDNLVLLFGGSTIPVSGGTNVVGETWVFQNGVWVNLTASLPVSPPARAGAGFAYDPVDGYVVLFGGWGGPGGNVTLDDTWTFHNMRWTELVTPTAPSTRGSPAMAWDPADGYVVLFSGGYYPAGYPTDTWAFHGGAWTRISTTGLVPPGRTAAAITYDGADGYVLMFGGWNGTDRFSDTWTYRAGVWTALHPLPAPSPRLMGNADMVYDPALQETVLFGGKYLGHFYNETWTFLAGSWTNVTPSLPVSPANRHGEGLVYLPPDGVLLMFGGETFWPQTLNDTWLFGVVSATSEFAEVGLVTLSSSCSAFRFGNVFVPPETVVAAARTTYGITAYPCGESFEKWILTGGLTLTSGLLTRSTASVAVSGSGTITAQFGLNRTPPGNLTTPSPGSDLGTLYLGLGLGALAGGLGVYFVMGPGQRAFPTGQRPPEPRR